MLARLHLGVGLLTVIAFLATGQYMDLALDHLRGMSDAQRLLFRSVHIYILLAGLVNLGLGLHLEVHRQVVARVVQFLGSALLIAGPVLLLLAFRIEPWLTGLDRPYTRPAVYGMLGGAMLHLVGAVLARALPPRHK